MIIPNRTQIATPTQTSMTLTATERLRNCGQKHEDQCCYVHVVPQ